MHEEREKWDNWAYTDKNTSKTPENDLLIRKDSSLQQPSSQREGRGWGRDMGGTTIGGSPRPGKEAEG